MGNGKSQPCGLVMEEKAFLSDNFWTLHSAVYGTDLVKKVTVFVGIVNQAETKLSALERFAKNLMIYRHPCILRYVASWKVHDQFHLATEEVQTLLQVLPQQTPLQICIGLHSILKALNFLHDKALSSHNNVCQAAVYVTPEGYWKLGGMEYLCRFSDLSARFLSESRQGRYERGIYPSEETRVPQPSSAIDQYAFCIMVIEILGKKLEDEVPGMLDFIKLCKTNVNSTDEPPSTSFDTLLYHSFFNHEFIEIHNFLSELPLKSEVDKQHFFRDLSTKLNKFNEDLVASHLGSLLLSRMVLLDLTAQQCLLPQVLTPRTGDIKDSLFSEKTFRKYIAPKLLSMFYVRDIQVRLTLLMYFKSYCSVFSTTELHSQILPELLVGIKDTNSDLVSATLRALADLVPILGAAKVIGGKRGKHFSDGRPKVVRQTKSIMKKVSKTSPKTTEIETEEGEIYLRERPSPDGGEELSLEPPLTEDETESWDNWDTSHQINSAAEETADDQDNIYKDIKKPDVEEIAPITTAVILDNIVAKSPPPPADLGELDVKLQVKKKPPSPTEEEIDFFRDMEPVILKTNILQISPSNRQTNNSVPAAGSKAKSKFDIRSSEVDPEGWGEELEWAEVDDG